MELTYENMMDTIEKYYDILPSINTDEDPGIVDTMTDFFTPDFKIRWSMPVKVWNREQWVGHLCEHSNVYRAILHYKNPPYYVFIDDRKKMAGCWVREQMKDPMTEELIMDFMVNVHFGLALHEGKVKFNWELISQLPARYHVDSLTE